MSENETTIRESQRMGTQRPRTRRPGLAVVIVATPVDAMRWRRFTIEAERVLERVTDGDQADSLMSRRHATPRLNRGRLTLRDGAAGSSGWRASANGTRGPTGQRLTDEPVRVKPGDIFQTGDTLWQVITEPEWEDDDSLLKGYSTAMEEARETIGIVASQLTRRLHLGQRVKLSMLVTGPRGSGKQMVAREVHRLLSHARPQAPFRQVSSPSLSDGTSAADLFGVVANYATSVDARPGYFEQAHGGVLLLDEVADTPPDAQAKLLNVLQEREVTRLGGSRPTPFDTLVIGATNRPVTADDAFRRDLLDRLATFRVELPPLRERPEDIAPLVRVSLREMGYPGALSAELMRELIIRWWPGNARELRNTLERLIALADHRGQEPDVRLLERVSEDTSRQATEDLPGAEPEPPAPEPASAQTPGPHNPVSRRPPREEFVQALTECGGNRSELARRWGTDPRQIRRWIAYYGLGEGN